MSGLERGEMDSEILIPYDAWEFLTTTHADRLGTFDNYSCSGCVCCEGFAFASKWRSALAVWRAVEGDGMTLAQECLAVLTFPYTDIRNNPASGKPDKS